MEQLYLDQHLSDADESSLPFSASLREEVVRLMGMVIVAVIAAEEKGKEGKRDELSR